MKIKVGIIGGAGYTGGELIRLLIQSSGCRNCLLFIAKAMLEILYHEVHEDLLGETDLKFTDKLNMTI